MTRCAASPKRPAGAREVSRSAGTNFGAVKQTLECLGGPEDYVVRVMHERVFRFMHRV